MTRFWQSTLAAAAVLALPLGAALGLVYSEHGEPTLRPDGSADDAPLRAAVLLLAISPGLLALLAAYFTWLAALLRRCRVPLLAGFQKANLITSGAGGLVFAVPGIRAFGLLDAWISFLTFGGLTLLCLSCGSVVWWSLAPGEATEST